jgi:hypothetical protein
VAWLKEEAEAYRNTCGTNLASQNLDNAAALVLLQEAELATLRGVPGPTYLDAIRLAQGCHDYSGGHSGTEGKAWHGAIDTVVDVLKRAAVGPWDSQTRAVYGVGVEAQAGEVAVPVAVGELDDQQREAVHQAVAEALGEAYDCTRVWTAWSYGTMGPDDFVPVAEDPDRVAEIADAAIEAIRAIPLPVPQAGEVDVESGLTRQSAFHCFRSRLTEEASSRYGLTSQDAEFDAFTSGASWAWATYVTAIAGGFGQAPQAGEVEA